MEHYIVYGVILLFYVILFILSRGFFRSAAHFLLKHIRRIKSWTDEQALSRALLIFFVMNLLACAVTVKQENEDTISKGYLLRNESGGEVQEETVEAEVETSDGQLTEYAFLLEIDPRSLTAEEKKTLLLEAKEELSELVLDGQRADYVTENLNFPAAMKNGLVEMTWSTDDYDLVSSGGVLGEELPEEGEVVQIHALLMISYDSSAVEDYDMEVTVYPKKLSTSDAKERELLQAIKEQNDPTEEMIILPEEVNGTAVHWSKADTKDGLRLLFLGLLLAVGMFYLGAEQKFNASEQRKQSLLLDYPQIVSKFVLYLGAGMSARMALNKMAEEYQVMLQKSGMEEKHAGYKEIQYMVRDMRNGMTEIEAYERMNRRCEISEYKAFSNILIQNSRKGGAELLKMLQRESEAAEELRRRNARRLGEEAGTKLLFPMLVMLMMVMAILMIPAVINFQF